MIEETSAGIVLFRKEGAKNLFLTFTLSIRSLGFCKRKNGKRRINYDKQQLEKQKKKQE